MAKMLTFGLEVSELEPLSRNYVNFHLIPTGKIGTPSPQAMG